jgi:hypothetical protein
LKRQISLTEIPLHATMTSVKLFVRGYSWKPACMV